MTLPPSGLMALIAGLVAAAPELAFLAQFTALGALIGATVALYRDRKHGPDGDRRAMIVTSWTLWATLIGLVLLVAGVA